MCSALPGIGGIQIALCLEDEHAGQGTPSRFGYRNNRRVHAYAGPGRPQPLTAAERQALLRGGLAAGRSEWPQEGRSIAGAAIGSGLLLSVDAPLEALTQDQVCHLLCLCFFCFLCCVPYRHFFP